LRHDVQVGLPFAALAQRTPRRRLIIDDHHVHHDARVTRGMRISATHWTDARSNGPSTDAHGPAFSTARSPKWTASRSRTLRRPMPLDPRLAADPPARSVVM